jgi:hypothetical protein
VPFLGLLSGALPATILNGLLTNLDLLAPHQVRQALAGGKGAIESAECLLS